MENNEYITLVASVNTEAKRYGVADRFYAETSYGCLEPQIILHDMGLHKAVSVSAYRVRIALANARTGKPSHAKNRSARWRAWTRAFVA